MCFAFPGPGDSLGGRHRQSGLHTDDADGCWESRGISHQRVRSSSLIAGIFLPAAWELCALSRRPVCFECAGCLGIQANIYTTVHFLISCAFWMCYMKTVKYKAFSNMHGKTEKVEIYGDVNLWKSIPSNHGCFKNLYYFIYLLHI